MKRMTIFAALAASLLSPGGALAAEQTVTLAVANMFCAACPSTVEKSLSAVPGVIKVAVSFEKKTALVTFDDQKTTIAAILAAPTNAGYPTKLAAAPTPTKTQ